MISARRAFEQQVAAKLKELVRATVAYMQQVAPQLDRATVEARAAACFAPYLAVDDETLSALELSSVRMVKVPDAACRSRAWTRHTGKAHPTIAGGNARHGACHGDGSVAGVGTASRETPSSRRQGVAALASLAHGNRKDEDKPLGKQGGKSRSKSKSKDGEGAAEQGAQADAGTRKQVGKTAPHVETVQYFFDQENTPDKDSAFVRWSATDPGELQVVCPVGTHLRRRRYIRVLGTALQEHMPGGIGRTLRVAFVPPQVNGVVALGCLGLFVQPQHDSPGCFTVHRDWQGLPTLTAQDWQFRTAWRDNDTRHEEQRGASTGQRGGQSQGCFQSSYFDMIGGAFRWAWRDSPFKSAVVALKRDGNLALRPVNWDALTVPARTELYGEYEVPGSPHGLPSSFFGTVGDVCNKRALLPADSAGRRTIDGMRVYFLHPSKPAALAAYLNERMGTRGPALDAARDFGGLPETALANFAKIWTPQMLGLVRTLVTTTPSVAESIVRHVPLDVRDRVRPPAGPRNASVDDTVLAVVKSIALYPDLAPKVLATHE